MKHETLNAKRQTQICAEIPNWCISAHIYSTQTRNLHVSYMSTAVAILLNFRQKWPICGTKTNYEALNAKRQTQICAEIPNFWLNALLGCLAGRDWQGVGWGGGARELHIVAAGRCVCVCGGVCVCVCVLVRD